jgi:hypothetical protein
MPRIAHAVITARRITDVMNFHLDSTAAGPAALS